VWELWPSRCLVGAERGVGGATSLPDLPSPDQAGTTHVWGPQWGCHSKCYLAGAATPIPARGSLGWARTPCGCPGHCTTLVITSSRREGAPPLSAGRSLAAVRAGPRMCRGHGGGSSKVIAPLGRIRAAERRARYRPAERTWGPARVEPPLAHG